jgi:hypothetical protein
MAKGVKMRKVIAAVAAAAGVACAPHNDSNGDFRTSSEATPILNGFVAIDLISPVTCQLQLSKLRQCVIAPSRNDALPMDTAVPLRTVVQRQMSGNCSTQFALAVAVKLDDADGVNLPFLSQSQLIVRRPDGGVAQHVNISDASPWTSTAVFADTCRISIAITPNEIDVDTPQQAHAILAAIDQDLARADTDVLNYQALLALQAAYTFTRSIAESFHEELTNDTMQALRRAAIDAAPAMQIAALGCGDALSEEQRDTLFQLYVSLVVLGDPSAWQNPDGSTKTLEQFYGPGGAAVLQQLQDLASHANPDLETEFRQGLESATQEQIRLQQKRALAVQQMAEWLGGAP